jgi:predicted protein tyrosine phosphatase
VSEVLPIPVGAVIIGGRSEAGSILCSPRKRASIAYAISIGGAAERPAAGLAFVSRRLRLVFEDELSSEAGGPSHSHIEQLIAFARTVDLARGHVLIHCEAGISRSPAAAVIVLRVVIGSGNEALIVSHVRQAREGARPNRRMLELADTILGTKGALVAALEATTAEGVA